MDNFREEPFTIRFIKACEKADDGPAIITETGNCSYRTLLQMVYAQMEFIAGTIANESVVAVADQNDAFTYASFIALNLLGKTWLPVSIRNPEAWNRNILTNAGSSILLSSKEIELKGIRVLNTSGIHTPQQCMKPVSVSSQPAYLLFTSGSTGTPKGVPVKNHCLHAFFDFMLGAYEFQASDRFLQIYEPSFDVSVFVAFGALFSGAGLYLLPRKKFLFQEIVQMLELYSITVLSMVPSVLNYLEPYFKDLRFEKLRYSFFSGDKLLHALAEGWSGCIPHARIINSYGPTETTIVCSHYPWNRHQSETESLNGIVPLGKLFPGMHALLIDEHKKEVARGEAGELCLSGPQVIDEYMGGVSEDEFFECTTSGISRTYFRTGDKVKLHPSGNFLFIGRTDYQVKINGYRVEPEETEAVLASLNNHKLCAVIPIKENGGEVLYAFLEGRGDEQNLLSQLRKVLPAPSVPRKIIFIDTMPMNRNGKIDRQELIKFVK